MKFPNFKKSSDFGQVWETKDKQWFRGIREEMPYIHESFRSFLKNINHSGFNGVLEIGCGDGHYLEYFRNDDYLGIDISSTGIELAKRRGNNFKKIDFLKWHTTQKFDLIFSHSVVDHSPNVDDFFTKSINMARKYVYHSAYYSHEEISFQHQIRFEPNWKIYYNIISIPRITNLAKSLGCKSCSTITIKHPNPKRQDGTIFIIKK